MSTNGKAPTGDKPVGASETVQRGGGHSGAYRNRITESILNNYREQLRHEPDPRIKSILLEACDRIEAEERGTT